MNSTYAYTVDERQQATRSTRRRHCRVRVAIFIPKASLNPPPPQQRRPFMLFDHLFVLASLSLCLSFLEVGGACQEARNSAYCILALALGPSLAPMSTPH